MGRGADFNNLSNKPNMSRMGSFWDGGRASVLDGRVCQAVLSEVNGEQRTCTIQTFGNDEMVAGGVYENIQIDSQYTSPEGAEVSVMPEVGSVAQVVFRGATPYITGFTNLITREPDEEINTPEGYQATDASGSFAQNKERLNPGDIIFRSNGKSRLLLRRGGEVELEAAKLCKRVMFPTSALINEICQNYEFRTDGGTIDWVKLDNFNSNKTLFRSIHKTDVSGTTMIGELKGTVDPNRNVIQQFFVAPGGGVENTNLTNGPVYFSELDDDGSHRLFVRNNQQIVSFNSEGIYEEAFGDSKYYKEIKQDGTRKENINNNFEMITNPDGSTTINIGIDAQKLENQKPTGGEGKFTMTITPDGKMNVKAGESIMTLDASGTITVTNGANIIEMSSGGSVKVTAQSSTEITSPDIKLLASTIDLGEAAGDKVPLGNLLLATLNKMVTTFNTHTHVSPFFGAPTSPSVTPMEFAKADILSSTVKVQT